MCDICGMPDNNHHPRCPYYEPPNPKYKCCICENGIYDGEEYIENDFGEYAHWDCFSGTKDLLNFLGYRIRIMEDE